MGAVAPRLLTACLLAALPACSGGGGSPIGFQVSGISVPDGSVWEVNREIVLTFTAPVDAATVSANTINIRSLDDVPATGVFELRDPRTVVFQPSCPTREDLADAGLQPGGVTYVLRVHGLDSSESTVRSVAGVPLGLQQTRTFTTPASTQASVAFQDTRSGPPAPLVRARGSADEAATHLELGGDPDARVWFERDPSGELVLSVPGFEAPLNLYSDPASRVAVVIAFDQPVNPAEENLARNRLRLEYVDSSGAWRAIDTRATLAANCTATGALVRLEPVGVLPPASAFRAVVLPGFQDLVGEATGDEQDDFARAPTRAVQFTSLTPADLLSDELNEGFDLGGEGPFSFEDTAALFDSPRAEWDGGALSSAFSFDGTGGPGGNFDWIVRAGERFFFDTSRSTIVGGPDGIPTATLTALGGVVDVRHLIIEEGGEIRVQGPNPMRVNATGDVVIRGKLDLSGLSARDVLSLNTGHQVEVGGRGMAGGGDGGDGNPNTSGSSARGGTGLGPLGQEDLGGQGGESAYSPDVTLNGKDTRRPGGGGGGAFARTWVEPEPDEDPDPTLSLEAKAGNDGHPSSTGAVTGARPARGGAPGAGPFLDASAANDFLGVKPVLADGELVGLIRGELPALWAGYGGGGGGNAATASTFPTPNWNCCTFDERSDEKGGGGGGGAGGLHVKALGRIVLGPAGQVVANGGRGATGENTANRDHVGGTGGGGSGGHVVLESATHVDFTDGGAGAGAALRDWIVACGPPLVTGPTGDVDRCCRAHSNGGPGGAGVVQIHVPRATLPPAASAEDSDIVVPAEALLAGDPLGAVSLPPAFALIPTFGGRSQARSRWISIGGADQHAGASEDLVRFLFGGLHLAAGEDDPDEGKVLTVGSRVADLTPLVTEDDLSGSTSARILADGYTLELTGAALAELRAGTTTGVSNDVYLRTPALLEGCAVRMRASPDDFEDFTIASAAYDEGTADAGDEVLRVTVSTERGRLDEFEAAGGTLGFQLVPRFFQVVTHGLSGALPATAFVRILFQAAADDGTGLPDEASPLTDWTADVARFNALPAGALQFFRYEVEFELDALDRGLGTGTAPVSLDFLKIPFVF